MKFEYGDLISGDSIPVKGIAHFRSPRLRELKPTEGIGDWTYNFYLNILLWVKSDFVRFLRMIGGKSYRLLDENQKLETFDVATFADSTCGLLREAMAFFIDEDLIWDKGKHIYTCISRKTGEQVGQINRDNFEEVRDMMLQMNYIRVGGTKNPLRHSSKKAQILWEKAQEYLKDGKGRRPDKRMDIGNVISKLCAASNTYNLLNIYDLTVFQLYDQFFQLGYLRAAGLSERIYCNHGGKDFQAEAWLEPIMKT